MSTRLHNGWDRQQVRRAWVLAGFCGMLPKAGYYDDPVSILQLERDGFLPLDECRYQAMLAYQRHRARRVVEPTLW